MSQNVKFYFTSQKEKYYDLAEKNPLALYFIEDAENNFYALYKGENLLATGSDATSMSSGLMSAEDKIKLDSLVVGSEFKLTPVDDTIVITDAEDGGKSIGVAISQQEGNALVAVSDGLFVSSVQEVIVPEYAIEKQETAEDGYVTSYKLKKTVGDEVTYVGDTINIAKDMVLQGVTLEVVEVTNEPYIGAVVGDPYIDMVFNDDANSHIYVPVKSLVDTYSAGSGIKIIDNAISVNIAEESNGLTAVDGALMINLATATSAGAMSAVDKAFIDSIPSTYVTIEQLNALQQIIDSMSESMGSIEESMGSIEESMGSMEDSYTWGEL